MSHPAGQWLPKPGHLPPAPISQEPPLGAPLPSTELSPRGQCLSPLSSKQQIDPVLFFAVIVISCLVLLCLLLDSIFPLSWEGHGIMLAAQLKTFLMRLCTFPRKPASSTSFSGDHAAPQYLGFVYSQLKQPFPFVSVFKCEFVQRVPSVATLVALDAS